MKRITILLSVFICLVVLPTIAHAQGISLTFTEEQLREYFNNRPTPDKWVEPTGKYEVVMEVDATLEDHTIYHPSDLSVISRKTKLPVVLMSGPGCDVDGDSYRPFWTEIASHGYLVIATGEPVPEGVRAPLFTTTTEDMKAGLEWIIKENERPESKYYHKIDTKHIALFGQSCGGIQALRMADEPRISLLVFWNSGSTLMGNIGETDITKNLAAPGSDLMGNRDLKELAKNLRIPVAYFVGDTDMARPHAAQDFDDIQTGVPVIYAVREIAGDSHAGTFREKNGGSYGTAGVALLDWLFKHNKKAAKMFKGNKSGLSQDAKWIEVKTKNL